jgi:two-component system sensor histidine kinase YesM
MSKKVNHLKDELRRTFTMYALIPTFIVASFILVLTFVYWRINVLEQNHSRLMVACQYMNAIVSSYMERANDIAALCNISQLREDKTARTEIYGKLYQYTHTVGGKTEFYLYDDQLNRLVSNQNQDPEFVRLARSAEWGIVGQIRRKPTAPNFVFVSPISEYGLHMDMVVGKAILEKGKITGYVLFVVPEAQFLSMMTNSYVDYVVKDKYNYMPLCTDGFFRDEFNKMKSEFIRAEGYLSVGDRQYYVSKSEILNGELTVYALTSIGGIANQLINTLCMLFGVLVILSLTIVISVKRQVVEKTKMIDQLVEAFSAAQNGNLDMRPQARV